MDPTRNDHEKKNGQIEGKAGPMLIEERRQHVLSQIKKNGRVFVAELSDSLSTSRITLRKDLDTLEGRGLLQRSHAPHAT
jgi:DeoR family transcriptional regulator of aga operon